MTTTLERSPTTSEPPPERRTVRMPGVRWQLLAVFVVWLLGWALWRGRDLRGICGCCKNDRDQVVRVKSDGSDHLLKSIGTECLLGLVGRSIRPLVGHAPRLL